MEFWNDTIFLALNASKHPARALVTPLLPAGICGRGRAARERPPFPFRLPLRIVAMPSLLRSQFTPTLREGPGPRPAKLSRSRGAR
jgi:hypothetical protein